MATDSSEGPAEAGPRRIWLVAVLFGLLSSVVLGALVVVATRSSGTTSGDDGAAPTSGPVDAVLLGDSITEQSEGTFEDRLGGRWSLWIDGRSGYTVEQQMPAAERAARLDPAQVVVNLGTNDVTRHLDPEASVARLRDMLALFPTAPCLHVVTVTEGMALDGRDDSQGARSFNRALRELADADPRVDVVDWDAALRREEAAGAAPRDLLSDTVHPTDRGEVLLADLYADALAACPAA